MSRLWHQLRADPVHAPELLAVAAVRRLGPPIAAEYAWLRATYPAATPAALARYARRRSVRRAAYGAGLAAASGALHPVAALLAALDAQARLVLATAAAFGRDPGHPDRAAELLVLVGAQPGVREATEAVALATERAATPGEPGASLGGLWRLLRTRRGEPLAVLALRSLRGGGVLGGALLATAAVERAARRAEAFYRR